MAATPSVSVPYLVIKAQVTMVIVLAYQLYLAVSTEIVDQTLKNVERISSWPVQALNIGLFVLVLGICWLYLQSTRKDLQRLQQANDSERKEYIANLKTMASELSKVVERSNLLYERIDKRLERLERTDPPAASGTGRSA